MRGIGTNQRGFPVHRLAKLPRFHGTPAGQLQSNFRQLLDVEIGRNIDYGARRFHQGETRLRWRCRRRGTLIRALLVFVVAVTVFYQRLLAGLGRRQQRHPERQEEASRTGPIDQGYPASESGRVSDETHGHQRPRMQVNPCAWRSGAQEIRWPGWRRRANPLRIPSRWWLPQRSPKAIWRRRREAAVRHHCSGQ